MHYGKIDKTIKMEIKCGHCKSIINTSSLSYRGFDEWFCSPSCRVKMWTKIYAIDSTFNNHEKWHDKKDSRKWGIEGLKKYDIESLCVKSSSEETITCSEASSSSPEVYKPIRKTKTVKSEIDLEGGLYSSNLSDYIVDELTYEKNACNIIIDNMTDRVLNNVMFVDISNSVKYAYNSIASYIM